MDKEGGRMEGGVHYTIAKGLRFNSTKGSMEEREGINRQRITKQLSLQTGQLNGNGGFK